MITTTLRWIANETGAPMRTVRWLVDACKIKAEKDLADGLVRIEADEIERMRRYYAAAKLSDVVRDMAPRDQDRIRRAIKRGEIESLRLHSASEYRLDQPAIDRVAELVR